MQITDTTEFKFPNTGSDLLQNKNIEGNNKNSDSKVENFIKSTITHSPTGHSGATTVLPIGNSFMYIETSSNNHGSDNIFVSLERTEIIQISYITFYYNRFSVFNIEANKSMSRFEIQVTLENNTWSTRYNIPQNDRYSNSSTQWTLVNLNFTVENYGIKLI